MSALPVPRELDSFITFGDFLMHVGAYSGISWVALPIPIDFACLWVLSGLGPRLEVIKLVVSTVENVR